VVAVLCHYGFVREGVLRSSAWVMGEFLDEVLLGLLAQDWKPDSKPDRKP
jgi:RimJ/RimL family protein N-acetyltransferase